MKSDAIKHVYDFVRMITLSYTQIGDAKFNNPNGNTGCRKERRKTEACGRKCVQPEGVENRMDNVALADMLL